LIISKLYLRQTISVLTPGYGQKIAAKSLVVQEKIFGKMQKSESSNVFIAEKNIYQTACGLNTALGVASTDITVRKVTQTGNNIPVYNLTIEEVPEFYANGILVHNCMWQPGTGMESPGRMDALVWCATELLVGEVGPSMSEWLEALKKANAINNAINNTDNMPAY
jgi:hypothetical protein